MRPNIVWVTLESLRADHATTGTAGEHAMPNVERIAASADGRQFSQCFSHAHWTPASSTSILTGTALSSHRVGYEDAVDVATVPEGLETVPELLGDAGYATAGSTTNGYVDAAGLDRGFDRFESVTKDELGTVRGVRAFVDYLATSGHLGPGSSLDLSYHVRNCLKDWYQLRELRRWIRRQSDAGAPFFGYVHFNNVHQPYRPPKALLREQLADSELSVDAVLEASNRYSDEIWDWIADSERVDERALRAVLAAYGAEVRYADRLVGEVFDLVASNPDTILVVTADHGELFGELGAYEHNLALHDALVNVPLVVHGLDLEGVPSDALVQHADVMQTLLAAVGVDVDQFQGYDLRTAERPYVLCERGPRHSDLEKLHERNSAFDADRYHWPAVTCLRSRDWKLVQSDDRTELFRLPDERTDVSDDHPERVRRMESELASIRPSERFESGDRAEIDAAMADHLRDMGYLE